MIVIFVPGNKEPLRNPKPVNCELPLTIPPGNCSDELIIPLSNEVRYEEVAALNASTSVCIELLNCSSDKSLCLLEV